MTVILHPTYFPSIWTGGIVSQIRDITWEQNDNYQKQTYRNRTRILSPNGPLDLTVPVQFTQKNRQLYRDVLISQDHSWRQQHWKSISTAYSNSPFFEFYKDDLKLLFDHHEEKLFDFNMNCINMLFELLELDVPKKFSSTYLKPTSSSDWRGMVNPQLDGPNTPRYIQVFENENGYVPNLSLLDLLFNLGPASKSYLLRLPLNLLQS